MRKIILLLLFYTSFINHAYSSDTLILDNTFGIKYILKNSNFEFFKDSFGLKLDSIIHNTALFKTKQGTIASNEDAKHDYWIRFNVKTLNNTAGFVVDIHSPNATQLELYQVDVNQNILFCGSTGLNIPYDDRDFYYKNLLLDMKVAPNSCFTYYVNVKKGGFCRFDFYITSFNYLLYSGSKEYYFLGMFYGLMLILIIYNLMMYFSLKDNVHLAYVLVLLFSSLKALSEDRTGAEFIWPNIPNLSYYLGLYIAPTCMLFAYIFYTHSFLNLKFWKDQHSKLILAAFAIHLAFYTIIILIQKEYSFSMVLVVLPYGVIMGVVLVRFFILKQRLSKYFVAGCVWFLLIIIIDTLRNQKLLFGGYMVVFSFYYFIVVQSVLLAYSMFERFTHLVNENKKLTVNTLEQERMHYGIILKNQHYSEFAYELKIFLSLINSPLNKLKLTVNKEDLYKVLEIKNLTQTIDLYANQLLSESIRSVSLKSSSLIEGDLVEFIKELLNSFEGLIAQKAINLVYTSGISTFYCKFEASKIEKIVFNLISNSIKFSDIKEFVYVDLAVDTDLKQFVLVVKDSGVHIKEEVLYEISNTFIDKSGSSLPPEGISLYFTKILVGNLNGTMEIESETNKGSIYTVIIPIELIDDSIFNDLAEYNSENSKPNILLVANNRLIGEHLFKELSQLYHVNRVVSNEEILLALNAVKPLVIVLDLNFAYDFNFEILDSIKEQYPFLKILLIISKNTVEFRSKLVQSKVDLVVFKPIKTEDIIIAINTLIKNGNDFKSGTSVSIDNDGIESISAFAKNVEMLIIRNLDNTDLNVEVLVKELGISRAQLYRKFGDYFGQSVKEYITEIRIKRAAELFQKEDLSIKEVMAKVGFNNRNYFIKCFKAYYFILPSEYKKCTNSVLV